MADRKENMPSQPECEREAERNPDPITGAPGSHPVGVGIGATGGGVTGAAIGAAGGPVGVAVGAAVGAIAGGLAGKAVAESIDPTAEEAYWRENYRNRPYVEKDVEYEVYGPAYRYGWESRARYADRQFGDVEPELERGWKTAKSDTPLTWDQAKHASRDAWERLDRPRSADAGQQRR
ncbi:MAG: hypothetical protein WD278_01280 [Pirellulales bacterium]